MIQGCDDVVDAHDEESSAELDCLRNPSCFSWSSCMVGKRRWAGMGFHEADAVVLNVRLGRNILLSQRKDHRRRLLCACGMLVDLCR